MAEYMRRFQQFERTIYGSELLSLANLQQDYNSSDAREDIGYNKILITVVIKNGIVGSEYFKPREYDIEGISEEQKEIEDEIEPYENPNEKYKNRSVKYYSQKSYREIAKIFDIYIPSNAPNYSDSFDEEGNRIKSEEEYLLERSVTKDLLEDIQIYVDLKSIYNEFRTGKQFDCVEIKENEYSGRLEAMRFVEITN